MEFFTPDINISKMSDSCSFGGKADICKKFDCQLSSHGSKVLNPTHQSAVEASQIEPIGRVDENDTTFVVSPEAYRTLLDNLYIARLWFLRARNITLNQLNVYKDEAIEHMHEIKRIVHKELDNPDVSARYVAQELVKAGIAVIRNQQALNRIEIEELVKNLDNLLDTLSSDVQEVKSLVESKYEEASQQRSSTELIFNYGHWCLFVLCVFFLLIMGLFRYLLAFEEYF